jgi:hypothetical protein
MFLSGGILGEGTSHLGIPLHNTSTWIVPEFSAALGPASGLNSALSDHRHQKGVEVFGFYVLK